MVTLMKHGKFAFFKPADDKPDWTFLQIIQSQEFDDALYYRDQFYFLDTSGTLFACDLNHPHNPVVSPVLASPPPYSFGFDDDEDKAKFQYLVQLSSGDLLLIKSSSGSEAITSSTDHTTIGLSNNGELLKPVQKLWEVRNNLALHRNMNN
ncbi:hypothetical protein FRX31_018502, partial [Thalictrum thalictroides]